jgi:hypothetical protein
MKLFVLFLNKPEYLQDILLDLASAGITGVNVLDSKGAMRYICHDTVEPPTMFGSMRDYMNPGRDDSKTLLTVIESEQLETVRNIVNNRTGGIEKPGMGVMFAVNLFYAEGTY